MKRGTSLSAYAHRRRFLVGWKYGHELLESERVFLRGYNPNLVVEVERFWVRFDGRLDRRYRQPLRKGDKAR